MLCVAALVVVKINKPQIYDNNEYIDDDDD